MGRPGALPPREAEKRGRDRMYDDHVADRGLSEPLGEAYDWLTSMVETAKGSEWERGDRASAIGQIGEGQTNSSSSGEPGREFIQHGSAGPWVERGALHGG